jgi:hypothetical protein
MMTSRVPAPIGTGSVISTCTYDRRQLLAHLNAGPRASADPTAFARTLALDHSVQQDGQEFMKLLLTLLERLLRESGNQVRDSFSTLHIAVTLLGRLLRASGNQVASTRFIS